MKNTLFKKGLVVGIIILFIGVGIQPAISNEIKITKTSDIEEDCFECQSNSKTHLAEKLLKGLEKNQVISNIINSGNPAFERPICVILNKTFWIIMDLVDYYNYLKGTVPDDSILFRIFEFYTYFLALVVGQYIINLLVVLDCWELSSNNYNI